MKKTLIALLVAGAIGLGGYSGNGYSNEKSELSSVNKYQFSRFGKIANGGFFNIAITQIRTADFDGDGDQDVIIGTEKGDLIIYENIMPQKGSLKEEEKQNEGFDNTN